MIPEVKTMGISKLSYDFDDIQIETLPVVFHVIHTGAGYPNTISDV